MAAADDSRERFTPLQLALMILAAVGLVGGIVTVAAANANPGWSRGWAILLTAIFFGVMLVAAFAAGLVPDGRVSGYRSSTASGRISISEFLPNEALRASVRRVAIHVALVLSLAIWILCWGIPISVMLSLTMQNSDADIDATGILVAITIGGVALVAYCVIQATLPQLTTQNAHLRSLRAAFPHAAVQPNRTSASVSWMVRNTSPGTRARRMGASYVVIVGETLSVWCHGKGRLTKAIEIPLASIAKIDYGSISLGIAGVAGITLDTTALTRPLELCPLDHALDWAASARRLGEHLSPSPHEAAQTAEGESS